MSERCEHTTVLYGKCQSCGHDYWTLDQTVAAVQKTIKDAPAVAAELREIAELHSADVKPDAEPDWKKDLAVGDRHGALYEEIEQLRAEVTKEVQDANEWAIYAADLRRRLDNTNTKLADTQRALHQLRADIRKAIGDQA